MPPLLSVVIVNFRADAQVQRLQHRLQDGRLEIIVVDNSNGKQGYGAGCNTGAERAQGEFVAFLNPDVEVTSQSLLNMVSVLQHHTTVGLVGPQILTPDGKIEITCSAIPNPWLAWWEYTWFGTLPLLKYLRRPYRLFGFDHRSSRQVPSVAGSCLVMRRTDWQKIGGFDEHLFLYFEEFDLASRLQDAGKTIWFDAGTSIVHFGQVSTKQIGLQAQLHFRQSRRYWFQKRYGLSGKIIVWLMEKLEEKYGKHV